VRNAFASLTSRLVVTVVALVVLVAILIGGAATAALRSQLTHQLDDDLHSVSGIRPGPLGNGPGTAPPGLEDDGGLDHQGGPQTLHAHISTTGGTGQVIRGRDDFADLSDAVIAQLAEVPVDKRVHQVELSGLGTYRVIAVEDGSGVVEVTGLPTAQVDEAISSLIGWEALLIVLGALLAAGGGLLLVRRQLRPLTEVAATAHAVAQLPLSEGDIDLTERVPEHLTDERTEVGQVGSALNTLLAHVETALEDRHRSEQQVRQFVADASHELRTPLATIAGYTELARRRPNEHIVRTALGKVEEESGRMTSLVEDMLLLARLDAGRGLEREPVDLTRLLVEAVDDARVLGPDHKWRLELPGAQHDVPRPVEDGVVMVPGDEQRLHQVVTNLLTNARKHTPAGTTVTVTVRADGFDVHDDGPGFPPDFVDHAFERFARVDQARERTGGAGLGLSLVEAIVRSHGGTVAITSAPTGTTIEVRLR
jgi:two-component system, OmpR family, sensor kinase